MQPVQIQLVQQAVQRLLPRRDEVAASFFRRLFMLNPECRRWLQGDLREPGRLFFETLAALADELGNEAALAGSVRELGERHRGVGVRTEHFSAAGAALIVTLQEHLGAEFTPQMRAAWERMVLDLAHRMIATLDRLPMAA